jgi:mono/diheme cytochrome c family protein
MPATEQTWRSSKLLHTVFGVSSLAMLLATVWMLVYDHNRPWKPYMEAMRTAEVNLLDMQKLQEQSGRFKSEENRLNEALKAARTEAPDEGQFEKFISTAESLTKAQAGEEGLLPKLNVDRLKNRRQAAKDASEAYRAAPGDSTADDAIEARQELIDEMNAVIKRVKFNEELITRDKKNTASFLSEARANYDLSIRDHLAADEQSRRLDIAKKLENRVADLEAQMAEANQKRNELEAILKGMTAREEEAKKALEQHNQNFDRFVKAEKERAPTVGKRVLEFPILDAFGGPMKPHQIWLPELTIKFPLNNVARFDRCMTCHAGMDKTLPGTAYDPAFPHEQFITLEITPQKTGEDGQPLADENVTLASVYGMQLAHESLIDSQSAAVVVFPESRAAKAGFRTADVIHKVNSIRVLNKTQAENYLLDQVTFGKPLKIEVRRGLPHPYSAHPRLDLIGSDSSPHPFGKMGCTICHEGQGTATAFQYAEHTPNTVGARRQWVQKYGWYANHYWDWPQKATRFVESSCLKCHHEVASLEASERFPEPPAPKLVQGYHLVRKFGCYGCHEIKGYAGPDTRIGPDLRTEPDYFAWGHLIAQAVRPAIVEKTPALNQALEAEAKLAEQKARFDRQKSEPAAEKTKLEERKKSAAESKDEQETARLDERLKSIDEQIKRVDDEARPIDEKLKAATARRLAAQRPLDDLREIYDLARRIEAVAEDSAARERLRKLIAADADRAAIAKQQSDRKTQLAAQIGRETDAGKKKELESQLKAVDEQLAASTALLPEQVHKFGPRLADIETPGTLRKVGPSVRHVASKLSKEFLLDWIESPRRFRPSTRMPHVFGNYEHLKGEGQEKELADAKRFEAVEIRGIAEYLLAKSEPFRYLSAPEPADGVIAPVTTPDQKKEQIERGRTLFTTRGCLACHSIKEEGRQAAEDDTVAAALLGAHKDARENQGPDLSKIGAKLAAAAKTDGRDPQKWLYSWLKQPNRYHSRTRMPDLFLDPVEVREPSGKIVEAKDAGGNPVPVKNAEGQDAKTDDRRPKNKSLMTDPAADIAAYLLSLQGWQPKPVSDVVAKDLDELAESHLAKAFRPSLAKKYLAEGIKGVPRETLKGDEVELLVGDNATADDVTQKKLLYVGRRAISKYGCYGCHDMPGFEDAKPIGTGLADWGRKETDKLAFEQIARYVGAHAGHDFKHRHDNGQANSPNASRSGLTDEEKRLADTRGYFHHELKHGTREGFIWQKLHEPRSFDYHKTETKTFNEWLRMPQFHFTEDEIEAVMTFVLGLVAEPPAPKYVYNPPPRQQAIIEGLKVLEKFNCAGCHVLRGERLAVSYPPTQPGQTSELPAPDAFNSYEFLRRPVTAAEVQASRKTDFAGRAHATLLGLPDLERETAREYRMMSDGTPYEPSPDEPTPDDLRRPFLLWEDAVLDGQVYYAGPKPVGIPEKMVDPSRSQPAWGGDLARLMIPVIFEPIKRNIKQDLSGNGVWALVPPPLIGQGRKVQTAWMKEFLLDPYPIRPSVQLRMPKFNMSPDEALKIAEYFAAVDGVSSPYVYEATPRDQAALSSGSSAEYREGALKIVTKVCSQCHLFGDFVPSGHPVAAAPRLDRIHRRMRPDYLKPWLANPPSQLPYTNMPMNLPHDSLSFQDDFPATSEEQLDAVVELLMNYDQYTKDQVPISRLVPKTAPADATKPGAVKTGAGGN